MLFNSLIFIFFFALVLVFHFNLKTLRKQNFFLVLVSYIYYSTWNPLYTLLLIFSTVLDWKVGQAIFKSPSKKKKQFFLGISIFFNFGILFFFKANFFFIPEVNKLLFALPFNFSPIDLNSIIIPIGLSFYTFQTVSYSFDIYNGTVKPEKSFLNYSLYVTFFSQLIAGPILKFTQFSPQTKIFKKFDIQRFSWGLFLFTLGIFQKTVISDLLLRPSSEDVYSQSIKYYSSLDACIATLSSGLQIYFDFAGYSTCAIATALCLGFNIPNNFWAPFGSIGYLDLWRRWHTSFWQWTKDYFYIPLGGNKKGFPRFVLNLILVFTFSGLWHGVTFPLLIWGLFNSFISIIEIVLRKIIPAHQFFKNIIFISFIRITTFLTLIFSVPLFRSPTIEKTISIYASIFGLGKNSLVVLETVEIVQALIPIFIVVLFHWYLHDKTYENIITKTKPHIITIIWVFMSLAILLNQGTSHVFVYFQF